MEIKLITTLKPHTSTHTHTHIMHPHSHSHIHTYTQTHTLTCTISLAVNTIGVNLQFRHKKFKIFFHFRRTLRVKILSAQTAGVVGVLVKILFRIMNNWCDLIDIHLLISYCLCSLSLCHSLSIFFSSSFYFSFNFRSILLFLCVSISGQLVSTQ